MLHFRIITQNLRVSNLETKKKEREEREEREKERMRDREKEKKKERGEGREEKEKIKKRREIQNKWRNCSLKYITLYTHQKEKKSRI